jgi:hypothetical protein
MPEERRRLAWRPLVRSLHRDAGYLAVGLTLVYAISGLAVNHLADWDPNFQNFRAVHELRKPLPGDTDAAVRVVLDQVGVRGAPTQVHRWAPDQLEIVVGERRINANPETGRIVEEGRKPRVFVRVANWLHLNRGKKSWTLFADLYAAGLLLLAISGIFMLPGKNGIRGRGAVLVAIGVAIPLLYVILSGGPEAESGRSTRTPSAPLGTSTTP